MAVLILVLVERGVDESGFGDVSAHDGEVGFLDFALLEKDGEGSACFFVETEEEDAGGGAVDAVGGVDVLADLVA